MWKGWEILFKMCDIWKICEKDAVDSPQLICSLTLIQSQKRLKDVLMQQKFSWMMAFIFDKSWSWVKCRFHWFSAKETMAGLKTFDFLHNNAVKSAKWRFLHTGARPMRHDTSDILLYIRSYKECSLSKQYFFIILNNFWLTNFSLLFSAYFQTNLSWDQMKKEIKNKPIKTYAQHCCNYECTLVCCTDYRRMMLHSKLFTAKIYTPKPEYSAISI